MRGTETFIEIDTAGHLLTLRDLSGRELRSYPVATAKYNQAPKFWATDYRNPEGSYVVRTVYPPGSKELATANSFHVPWYLSSKAQNPHQDAGLGLFGSAMIMFDYPNPTDYSRYVEAKRSGHLRQRWEEFCEVHLRPIYEDLAKQAGAAFKEVRMDGDYGNRTFQELLHDFPVADPTCAFRLGVGIHGTNDPKCIGTDKTAGCFRMHDRDILELLKMIGPSTRIEIDPPKFFSM